MCVLAQCKWRVGAVKAVNIKDQEAVFEGRYMPVNLSKPDSPFLF